MAEYGEDELDDLQGEGATDKSELDMEQELSSSAVALPVIPLAQPRKLE
jgi:hypothetical protein